jgi:hypothetical protein
MAKGLTTMTTLLDPAPLLVTAAVGALGEEVCG